MAKVYLTRIESFNAAHRLFNPKWSEEKNIEVFGKCYSPNYHGHNYELHVTITGSPFVDTGFVYNAKKLGNIIKEHIVEQIDHKNLNVDVLFLKNTFTSAENLIIGIWNILFPILHKEHIELYKLKLYETPKIYVTYKGELNKISW